MPALVTAPFTVRWWGSAKGHRTDRTSYSREARRHQQETDFNDEDEAHTFAKRIAEESASRNVTGMWARACVITNSTGPRCEVEVYEPDTTPSMDDAWS